MRSSTRRRRLSQQPNNSSNRVTYSRRQQYVARAEPTRIWYWPRWAPNEAWAPTAVDDARNVIIITRFETTMSAEIKCVQVRVIPFRRHLLGPTCQHHHHHHRDHRYHLCHCHWHHVHAPSLILSPNIHVRWPLPRPPLRPQLPKH